MYDVAAAKRASCCWFLYAVYKDIQNEKRKNKNNTKPKEYDVCLRYEMSKLTEIVVDEYLKRKQSKLYKTVHDLSKLSRKQGVHKVSKLH